MKLKISRLLIPVFGVLLIFSACNSGDKKAKPDEANTPEMDAVQAAPALYKVLNDSMGLRILEVTYNPGDSSVMHSHADLVSYIIEGGSMTFTGKDGKQTVVESKPGTSLYMPAQSHSVKNTGNTTVKVILFEIKRSNQSPVDPAMDAVKISPEYYKTIIDTLGVRVLEVNQGPGLSSAMHSHPDNAVYFIEGGNVEFTDKDGNKKSAEATTGLTMIRPSESHASKNTGNRNIKVLLVEVNRTQ